MTRRIDTGRRGEQDSGDVDNEETRTLLSNGHTIPQSGQDTLDTRHNAPQETPLDHQEQPLTWKNRIAAWYTRYRVAIHAAGKALALFTAGLLVLLLVFKLALPPLDEEHRRDVKIPKSFEELKRWAAALSKTRFEMFLLTHFLLFVFRLYILANLSLNTVLQIYKDRNFARVLMSYMILYFFLQAYSIPGSMYLSILAGAMYGVAFALPLVCFCVATGATLCYLFSALLGPALLLASAKWSDRIEAWRERIRKQGNNVFSYLVVLRIAPLPPHWFVNVAAPHLDISVPMFWISTFFGVMAVSFIHVQIGTTLDQMTSPSEFRLISWRNFFGLAGVVIGVMIPVVLRYAWRKELAEAAEDVVQADERNGESLPDAYPQHVRVDVSPEESDSARQAAKTRSRNIGRHPGSQDWGTLNGRGLVKLDDDEEEEEGEQGEPASPQRGYLQGLLRRLGLSREGPVRL